MEKIFTPGPMQNIDWSTNGQERCIPHLIADSLNGIVHNQNLQLWNNNTPKTIAEFNNSDFTDFSRYANNSILKKNEFMEVLGYGSSNTKPNIITDTGEAYAEWLNGKIERLFSDGIIYEGMSEFHTCNNCGNMMAESAAEISATKCGACGGDSFSIKKEIGIFLDLPENRDVFFVDKDYSKLNPASIKDLSNRFKLMPPRVFLNKRRSVGILLERAGYSGFVVDPKIAISLLPEFASEQTGVDEIVQIQGVSTATNTIPYTSLLNSGSYRNSYIFINKTPGGILFEKPLIDSGFYGYLLGVLTSKLKPMNIGEFGQVKKEYLSIFNNLRIANKWLTNENAASTIELNSDIVKEMKDMYQAIQEGQFFKAMKFSKKIVNSHLAHDYARRCYDTNARIIDEDMRAIRELLQPLYGDF